LDWLRSLVGYDFFIAYSRLDGAAYAAALATELSRRGYTCFLDLNVGSVPDLPSALLTALRSSQHLIVIASPGATTSRAVKAEIAEFQRARPSRPIIPISAARNLEQASWYPLVRGVFFETVDVQALADGAPSQAVIQRITSTANYTDYTEQRKRLFRLFALFGAATSGLLGVFAAGAQLLSLVEQLIRNLLVLESPPPELLSWPAKSILWVVATGFIPGALVGFAAYRLLLTRQTATAERTSRQTAKTPRDAFRAPFISYSHADKKFALKLQQALAARGVKCWLDEKQLQPGDVIRDEVAKAIQEWDGLLLCCSKNSLTSYWVDAEVAILLDKEERLANLQKRKVNALIPLVLDQHLFSAECSTAHCIEIRRRLGVDFSKWRRNQDFEAKLQQLMSALKVPSTDVANA